MIDPVDLIGYFASFWLFLFNDRYRNARTQEWVGAGWFGRSFILIEMSISSLIGLGGSVAIIFMAFRLAGKAF